MVVALSVEVLDGIVAETFFLVAVCALSRVVVGIVVGAGVVTEHK